MHAGRPGSFGLSRLSFNSLLKIEATSSPLSPERVNLSLPFGHVLCQVEATCFLEPMDLMVFSIGESFNKLQFKPKVPATSYNDLSLS